MGLVLLSIRVSQIPALELLQHYTLLMAVVKCSTGVPLKRECEALEYLAVLSPQYISVSVYKTNGDLPKLSLPDRARLSAVVE